MLEADSSDQTTSVMPPVERYIVDSYPRTDRLVADGLDWLVHEAIDRRTKEAAVLVPRVGCIPILGLGNGLSRDRQFFRDGIDVKVLLTRKRPSTFGGPLLVAWANSEMVASAEQLNPCAICATGWERDGLADWVRVWGATDPRTGEHFPPEAPAPVLVGAVASLALDVLHTTDKRHAVDTLRALKMCGREIDPPMMRGIAIQRGWSFRAADRLYDLAKKFALGKPVQGGSRNMTKTAARQMVTRFEEEGSIGARLETRASRLVA
jgi:hypothetical protein